jgi:glycerol uptake facilitator-like aquaporin
MPTLPQRLFCEGLGTTLLLAAVVGSGIMAEKLAGGNGAVALLCNILPTGATLVVLILATRSYPLRPCNSTGLDLCCNVEHG